MSPRHDDAGIAARFSPRPSGGRGGVNEPRQKNGPEASPLKSTTGEKGDGAGLDRARKWLPVSDALQTGMGLFYEFKFGILNGRTGLKRILLEEELEKLRQERIRPSRVSLILNAHNRALEIKRRLESTPGLTRSAVAKELGVNRARITQILRRFKN